VGCDEGRYDGLAVVGNTEGNTVGLVVGIRVGGGRVGPSVGLG